MFPLRQTTRFRELNMKLHHCTQFTDDKLVDFILNETSESEPQLKLDIRKEPIPEEDGDAQSAFSNVANTLRAVCPPNTEMSSYLLTWL